MYFFFYRENWYPECVVTPIIISRWWSKIIIMKLYFIVQNCSQNTLCLCVMLENWFQDICVFRANQPLFQVSRVKTCTHPVHIKENYIFTKKKIKIFTLFGAKYYFICIINKYLFSKGKRLFRKPRFLH